MIAAGLYGFTAMIQFAKSARPTQLSSEHGWRAKPPAGWAESSILRTAAQPPQGEGSGVVVDVITRVLSGTRKALLP